MNLSVTTPMLLYEKGMVYVLCDRYNREDSASCFGCCSECLVVCDVMERERGIRQRMRTQILKFPDSLQFSLLMPIFICYKCSVFVLFLFLYYILFSISELSTIVIRSHAQYLFFFLFKFDDVTNYYIQQV